VNEQQAGSYMSYNTAMTQTLGQQLKAIRQSRGISLEEIAETTHIRLAYLQAIEEGEVDDLPSPVQMRGFIRLYAATLGIEFEDLQVQGYHLTHTDEEEEEPSEDPIEESDEDEAGPEPEGPEDAPIDAPSEETEPQAEDLIEDEAAPSTQAEEPQPGDQQENTEDSALPEAELIFKEIGEQLRQRRDLLSLTLEDVEAHTHVRKHYLELIEAGNFGELPSPVQARGMLANYTEFLNLDVDAILLYYAEGLQKQRLESQIAAPKRSPARSLSPNALKLKNFFSIDLLVIAGIFLVFATFVIWGVNRILTVDTYQAAATDLPEVADVLLATSSAGTPTPEFALTDENAAGTAEGDGTEVVEATPLFTSVANTSPVNLVILPRHNTWVQVYVDYELAFQGRMLSGNAYDYSANAAIELNTGNAGSLQILFNDQDVGTVGLIGQVVNLVFTENGLVQPTPTITPAPTLDPEATPSPTPTQTPTNDEAN
jgi:cytoskeletal protein RodZ